MAVILNKNSFWLHLQLTAFCIKNNPRENRFFAASGRLADGKGTHNVKILAENYTKDNCIANTHVGKRYEKHVRLLPSARAVARHAAQDPRRQNYTPVRDKDLPRIVPIAYSFQCALAVPRAYSRRNSMQPMPHRDS